MSITRILVGDCRETLRGLADGSIQTCVTSPPYLGLRSYLPEGHAEKDRELGAEASVDAYVANLVAVFRAVRRILRDDGTVFLNLGDSYAGGKVGNTNGSRGSSLTTGTRPDRRAEVESAKGLSVTRSVPGGLKPKNLIGVPWRVAFALQADGWYLRSAMPWIKRNCMPERTADRPTSAVEYVFLLSKRAAYFWDQEAARRPNAPGTAAHHDRYSNRPVVGKGGNPHRKDKGGTTQGGVGYVGSGRNLRNSDPWFDSLDALISEERAYLADLEAMREGGGLLSGEDGAPLALDVNTKPYSGAHFATFPPALVEPCVKAGTSERGQCGECGASWRRVVERAQPPTVPPSELDRYGTGDAGVHRKVGGQYQKWLDANPPQTTGWEPSCSCDAGDPVPQTVLDPFSGSGTTGLVANRLGRDAILCELNPAYAEIARERLRTDGPLFVGVG